MIISITVPSPDKVINDKMPSHQLKSRNNKKISSKVTQKPKQKTSVCAAPDLGQRASTSLVHQQISIKLQQFLLDIIKNTFKARWNSDLNALIQEVKQNLYHRDFCNAFGNQDYLEAYAIRWTATRALAYLDIFQRLPQLRSTILTQSSPGLTSHMLEIVRERCKEAECSAPPVVPQIAETNASRQEKLHPREPENSHVATQVVCLGGGAGAEILALAGHLTLVNSSLCADIQAGSRKPAKLEVTAIDIADWSSVIDRLHLATTADHTLCKPTSPVTEAITMPWLDPNIYDVRFIKQDVLQIEESTELQAVLRRARLVTIMFTLNELYSVSMSATTKLLLSMTSILEPGSLLLVLDSPGSYSTVSIGSKDSSSNRNGPPSSEQGKKYPMQWLLDHTLLDAARIESIENANQWEKLYSSDSTWFRHSPGLSYPIILEDMRYQVHLYRRL